MNTPRNALAIALMLGATIVHSETVTAICRGPSGTTVVYGDSKAENSPDGFAGGFFTYSWNTSEKVASIVSQSGTAAGSEPMTEQAGVISSPGFVSFVVVYERALWIHTLYPDAGVIMISRHKTSSTPAGELPLGSLMHGRCKVASR